MQEPEGDGVPPNVEFILKKLGIFIPVGLDEGQLEVFQQAIEGRCMTCNSPLGGTTVLVSVQQGVVGAYCHTRCLKDMQVIGFLSETLNDYAERVAFRGELPGDQPQEEDDGNDIQGS